MYVHWYGGRLVKFIAQKTHIRGVKNQLLTHKTHLCKQYSVVCESVI